MKRRKTLLWLPLAVAVCLALSLVYFAPAPNDGDRLSLICWYISVPGLALYVVLAVTAGTLRSYQKRHAGAGSRRAVGRPSTGNPSQESAVPS